MTRLFCCYVNSPLCNGIVTHYSHFKPFYLPVIHPPLLEYTCLSVIWRGEIFILRLLMVEDDRATVESVKIGFEIYLPGITFTASGTGREALQMLTQDNYDCVLVDLGLPDINGIELINQIRSFSQIPLVVLSARSSHDVIYQALKSGANEYVIKPFDPLKLFNLLTNLMGNCKSASK